MQAAIDKRFEFALTKLDALEMGITEWRKHIQESMLEEASSKEPEPEPELPSETIEFQLNVTFKPEKCPRKSMEGSIMKVHYVGQLMKTKKTFASSFHTGP